MPVSRSVVGNFRECLAAAVSACLVVVAMIACCQVPVVSASGTVRSSRTNISEWELISGCSLRLVIVGDRWVSPVTPHVASELIAAFTTSAQSGYAGPAGFRNRQTFLLTADSFSVTGEGSDLTVTFQADPSFDITRPEYVNFTAPASSLTSGTPSVNRITVAIRPSRGVVTSGPLTLTEAAIRRGGSVVTLQLAAGETWRNVSLIRTWAAAGTSWERWKRAILFPTQSSQSVAVTNSGRDAHVVLRPAPDFDATADEFVYLVVPGSSTASRLAPQHAALFLRVQVVSGTYFMPSTLALRESELYAHTVASTGDSPATMPISPLVVSLEAGETWRGNITAVEVQNALSAVPHGGRENGAGFMARSSLLLPNPPVVDSTGRVLTVELVVDPAFDIDVAETVTFSPPASFVVSGLRAALQPGSPTSFLITPSAATLVRTEFAITEDTMNGGYNLTVTLFRGERFRVGIESVVAGALAGPSRGVDAFEGRRNALVPAVGGVVVAADARSLLIRFAASVGYNIDVRETIVLRLNGTVVESGLDLVNGVASLLVTPSAGLLTIAHSSGRRRPFAFTESELRGGAGQFILTWSSTERWREYAMGATPSFSLVDNSTSTLRADRGWNALRGALSTAVAFSANRTVMLITLPPLASYDIASLEIVRVVIPAAAIASRLPSRDGFASFEFRVLPAAGRVSLVCCAQLTQHDIARGLVRLVLRLAPGETWVPGYDALWREALVSNATTSDEPNGWERWKSAIVSSMMPTTVHLANNSRDMVLTLLPSSHYRLARSVSEEVTITLGPPRFPLAFVSSGLQPTPASLQFTIARAPTLLNMTVVAGGVVLGGVSVAGGGREGMSRAATRVTRWGVAPGEQRNSTTSIAVTEQRMRDGNLVIVLHCFGDAWSASSGTAAEISSNGVFSNVTVLQIPLGFDRLRSTVLPVSGVRLPVVGQELRLVFSAAPSYSIDRAERISIRMPGAAMASGIAPQDNAALHFDVIPTPATVSSDPPAMRRFTEGDLQTQVVTVVVRLEGPETFKHPGIDYSDSEFLTAFSVSSTRRSPRGFMEQFSQLLRSVEILEPERTTMNLRFGNLAAFDVVALETVTFHVLPFMLSSGLRPRGGARVVFWIEALPPLIRSATFVVTEEALLDGATPPLNVVLQHDTFAATTIALPGENGQSSVTRRILRSGCTAALLRNVTVHAQLDSDRRLVVAALPTLLPPNASFTVSHDLRTLVVRLGRPATVPASDSERSHRWWLLRPVTLRFVVPSMCTTTGDRALGGPIAIVLTTTPARVAISPSAVSEETLRRRGLRLTFQLIGADEWNPRFLATYLATSLRALTSPQTNVGDGSWNDRRSTFLRGVIERVSCAQVDAAAASASAPSVFCVRSPKVFVLWLRPVSTFAIDTAEPVSLAPDENGRMMLVNSTIPVLSATGGGGASQDWPTFVISPTAGSCSMSPRSVSLVEHDLHVLPAEGGSRLIQVNITLAFGERFLDSQVARTRLLDAFAVGGSISPNGFSALRGSLLPTARWRLSGDRRTWSMVLVPTAAFSLSFGSVEAVRLPLVPGECVASGLAANASSFLLRVAADQPANSVVLTPVEVTERALRAGSLVLVVTLVGPWPQRFPANDTWETPRPPHTPGSGGGAGWGIGDGLDFTVMSTDTTVSNPHGFAACLTAFQANASFVVDGSLANTLRIAFPPCREFDIARSEVIELRFRAASVRSREPPVVIPRFSIVPAPGQAVVLTTPSVIQEYHISDSVMESASVDIVVTGDTFVQTTATLELLRGSCVSVGPAQVAPGAGWATRNATVLPLAAVRFVNASVVRFSLRKDTVYDLTSSPDTVECQLRGSLFLSGSAPTPSTVGFVIANANGRLVVVSAASGPGDSQTLDETQVAATGFKVLVGIQSGETWNQSAFANPTTTGGQILITALRASFSVSFPNGGVDIVEATRLASSLAGHATELVWVSSTLVVFTVSAIPSFDIYFSNVTVSFCLPPAAVVSARQPDCASARFTIKATPGRVVTLFPSALPGTGSPLDVPAEAIRRGVAVIGVEVLGDSWDPVVCPSAIVASLVVSPSAPGEESGFAAHGRDVFRASNVTFQRRTEQGGMRASVMRIMLGRASRYRIWNSETLVFRFPATCFTTGLVPVNAMATVVVAGQSLALNRSSLSADAVRHGFSISIVAKGGAIDVPGFSPSVGVLLLEGITVADPSHGAAGSLSELLSVWKRTATISAVTSQAITLRFAPLPQYRPCALMETISFSLPDTLLSSVSPVRATSFATHNVSVVSQPSVLMITAAARSRTSPTIAAGGAQTQLVVTEDQLRVSGLVFNVSLSFGGFSIEADTLSTRVVGSLGCVTGCFSSLRNSMMPASSVRIGTTTLTVRFLPTPLYNVVQDEYIYVGIRSGVDTVCPAALAGQNVASGGGHASSLSILVRGGNPHVSNASISRTQGRPSTSFVVRLFGYELRPATDVLDLVLANEACATATSRRRINMGLRTMAMREVNVTFRVAVAGVYRLCYRFTGAAEATSSFALPVPTMTVLARLLRMVPVSSTGVMPLGRAVTLTFVGEGLDARASIGDSVRLLALDESPHNATCSWRARLPRRQQGAERPGRTENTAVFDLTAWDLDGDGAGLAETNLTFTLRNAGRFAVCYRSAPPPGQGGPQNREEGWVHAGSFETVSSVVGIVPRHVEPSAGATVVTIVGNGLDTRRAHPSRDAIRRGVRGGDVFLLTEAPTCGVSGKGSRLFRPPLFNTTHIHRSDLLRFNVSGVGGNASLAGGRRGATAFSVALVMNRPAVLHACHATFPTYTFRRYPNAVSFLSTVTSLAHITPNEEEFTTASSEPIVLTISGVGLDLFEAKPFFVAIPFGSSCSSLRQRDVLNPPAMRPPVSDPSDGAVVFPAKATQISGSAVALAHFSFPMMGVYQLCWTSQQRSAVQSVDLARFVGLYVAPFFRGLAPTTVSANADVVFNVSVLGAVPANVTAILVPVNLDCRNRSTLDVPLAFAVRSSSSVRLQSSVVRMGAAGTYRLCAWATNIDRPLEGLQTVVVSAVAFTDSTQYQFEQFDDAFIRVRGVGLSTADSFWTAPSCPATGTTGRAALRTQGQLAGAVELLVYVDTSVVAASLALCYRSANASLSSPNAQTTVASLRITSVVPRVTRIVWAPDLLNGTRVVFTVFGKGLGSRDDLFVGTPPNQWKPFPRTTGENLNEASFTLTNNDFPLATPARTYPISYHLGGQPDDNVTSHGVFPVPFANTPPSFAFAEPAVGGLHVISVYSRPVAATRTASEALVSISPGWGLLDARQTVRFTIVLRTPNTTAEQALLLSAPPVFTAAGHLIVKLKARAEGFLTFEVTADDDSGSDFGGNGTSPTLVFRLQVTYAFNTPPSFVLRRPTLDISSIGPTNALHIPQFLTNILPGNASLFENDQTVTFVASVITGPSLLLATIDSNGTLNVTLLESGRTLTRHFACRVSVFARDSGGATQTAGEDTSPMQFFTVNINVPNFPPTFASIAAATPILAYPEQSVSTAVAANLSVGPNGTDWQTAWFVVASIVNADDATNTWAPENFFASVPVINGSGTLVFRALPAAAGAVFTVTYFAQDDGGAKFGSQDRSGNATLDIHVMRPFGLNVAVSGPALETDAVITVSGGTTESTLRVELLRYFIFTGASLPGSKPGDGSGSGHRNFSFDVRRHEQTSFQFASGMRLRTVTTPFLPPDRDVTVWCQITLFTGLQVFAWSTVRVAPPSSSGTVVALTKAAAEIKTRIVSDPEGAALGLLAASAAFATAGSSAEIRPSLVSLLREAFSARKLRAALLTEPEVVLAFRVATNLLAGAPTAAATAAAALLSGNAAARRAVLSLSLDDDVDAPLASSQRRMAASIPSLGHVQPQVLTDIGEHLGDVMAFTNLSSVFAVSSLNALVNTVSTLLDASTQLASPLWTTSDERENSAASADTRKAQNRRALVALSPLRPIARMMCAARLRGESASSLQLTSTQIAGHLSLVVQTVRTTNTSTTGAGSFSTSPGVASGLTLSAVLPGSARLVSVTVSPVVALLRPGSVCVLLVALSFRDTIASSGDPLAAPRYPPGIVWVDTTNSDNESLVPLTSSAFSGAERVVTDVTVTFPAFDSAGESVLLTAFDREALAWSPGSIPSERVSTSSFRVTASRFGLTRGNAGDGYFFGLTAVAPRALETAFPVIVVPVFAGLLVVFLAITYRFDGGRYWVPRPLTPHSVKLMIFYCKSLSLPMRLLRSHAFTALWFPSDPMSHYTRPQRFAVVFAFIYGCLFFVTVSQENKGSLAFLLRASDDFGRMALYGFGSAFGAFVAAFVFWFGFTRDDDMYKALHGWELPELRELPEESLQASAAQVASTPTRTFPMAQASERTNSPLLRVVWTSFFLAYIAATIGIVMVSLTFDTEYDRNVNIGTFFFALMWSALFWETVRVFAVDIGWRMWNAAGAAAVEKKLASGAYAGGSNDKVAPGNNTLGSADSGPRGLLHVVSRDDGSFDLPVLPRQQQLSPVPTSAPRGILVAHDDVVDNDDNDNANFGRLVQASSQEADGRSSFGRRSAALDSSRLFVRGNDDGGAVWNLPPAFSQDGSGADSVARSTSAAPPQVNPLRNDVFPTFGHPSRDPNRGSSAVASSGVNRGSSDSDDEPPPPPPPPPLFPPLFDGRYSSGLNLFLASRVDASDQQGPALLRAPVLDSSLSTFAVGNTPDSPSLPFPSVALPSAAVPAGDDVLPRRLRFSTEPSSLSATKGLRPDQALFKL